MPVCYNYACPNCSQECSVEDSLTGQNVLCPHCSQEFFASPPPPSTSPIIPEKLPFFKSGRKKILKEQMEQLVADGEMSAADEDSLNRAAILLGLDQKDVVELAKDRFFEEFRPIQQRVEKAWVLTDDDLEQIETLKRKYGVRNLSMEGFAGLYRQTYLLEAKGELPPPIIADLMLDSRERAYFSVGSTWHQTRVKTHGYAGSSFSVPTGIRGVRFRFGSYKPIRSEEITPLSTGILYCTNKRLLFGGESRNTKVDFKKILDADIFSDCLKIEKETGKADYFTMNAPQARFITALIGHFRQ